MSVSSFLGLFLAQVFAVLFKLNNMFAYLIQLLLAPGLWEFLLLLSGLEILYSLYSPRILSFSKIVIIKCCLNNLILNYLNNYKHFISKCALGRNRFSSLLHNSILGGCS